jgi:unsaturated chondroitin disaccharide hydrolase
MQEVVRDSLDFSAAQYTRMLADMADKTGYPRSVKNGQVTVISPKDWTCGFFPGSLWYLYEATGDARWRAAAEQQTAGLESVQHNTHTHDLGFMLYCSYGNGLRLTGNPAYATVLATGAATLSQRFNPVVGSILSWDPRKGWKFPVIIDNMMNLELLFWAAKTADAPRLREIAIRHADTTLQNHYRPDGSCFHVVDYDPADGKVLHKQTAQGAADDSSWARGQMWGLYGFTLMYRETRDPRYLAQAQKIAGFVMNHPRMPADKVPYWDFDAPGIPDAPRDSSAAAIMCSALYELSGYVDAETGRRYATYADDQLRSLASPAYRAKPGENHDFLLMHATGNHPANDEIDVPINYGDYYFLEALLRCKARLAHPAP